MTLDRAYLTVGSVELVECAMARVWRALAPLPLARAHEDSSPTFLGAPWVEDVLGADAAPEDLGVLEPPPGSLCGLVVTFGPADGDAAHLPGAVDMVGKSVHIDGTWMRSGSLPRPFTSERTTALAAAIDLDSGPLTLSAEVLSATVVIDVDLTTWFNGIDFATADAATVDAGVAANLQGTVRGGAAAP